MIHIVPFVVMLALLVVWALCCPPIREEVQATLTLNVPSSAQPGDLIKFWIYNGKSGEVIYASGFQTYDDTAGGTVTLTWLPEGMISVDFPET